MEPLQYRHSELRGKRWDGAAKEFAEYEVKPLSINVAAPRLDGPAVAMLKDERCFWDFEMEEALQTVFLKLTQVRLQGLPQPKAKLNKLTDLEGLLAVAGRCARRETGFKASRTALPLRPSSPNMGAAAVTRSGSDQSDLSRV